MINSKSSRHSRHCRQQKLKLCVLCPEARIIGLGTASILSMAIAGASVANAIQTDFGAELKALGFAIDSEAFGQPSDTDTGWANYLRLKADFKDENTGVSVHTSIELAGSRWRGDGRGTVVSPGATGHYNPSSGGDNTRLDLGATWVLPRLIGRARAMAVTLLGERIHGPEAVQRGLI